MSEFAQFSLGEILLEVSNSLKDWPNSLYDKWIWVRGWYLNYIKPYCARKETNCGQSKIEIQKNLKILLTRFTMLHRSDTFDIGWSKKARLWVISVYHLWPVWLGLLPRGENSHSLTFYTIMYFLYFH